MNIFVLCTGRCGSVSFARACAHLDGFTVGHETKVSRLGDARVRFPDRHIEVDNRLSWFLGRLERHYGDQGWYVHLRRDRDATAASFNRRWHLRSSIMRAYCDQILMSSQKDPLAACYDYVDTITENIEAFLKGKPHVLRMEMERGGAGFREFIDWIGASGDIERACAEWDVAHNAS